MSGLLIFCCNIFFLIISSYFDIKKRIIPNRCVLFMLSVFFSVNAGVALITGRSPEPGMAASWIFSSASIIMLFLPAEIIIKGKRLGSGDKKILMVLALSVGVWRGVLLVFGMLIAALIYYVLYEIVIRKDELRTDPERDTADNGVEKALTIPMAPFILVSYVIVGIFTRIS